MKSITRMPLLALVLLQSCEIPSDEAKTIQQGLLKKTIEDVRSENFRMMHAAERAVRDNGKQTKGCSYCRTSKSADK